MKLAEIALTSSGRWATARTLPDVSARAGAASNATRPTTRTSARRMRALSAARVVRAPVSRGSGLHGPDERRPVGERRPLVGDHLRRGPHRAVGQCERGGVVTPAALRLVDGVAREPVL